MMKRALGYSLSLHMATAALLGGLRTSMPAAPQAIMVDWIEVGEPSPMSRPAFQKAKAKPATPAPDSFGTLAREKDKVSQVSAAPGPVAQDGSDSESIEGQARKVSLEDYYKAQVWKELQKRKSYPATARRLGQTGRVVLRFKIGKDGEILHAGLVEKSQFSSLNLAAESLLASLDRFQPIPEELKRVSWEFTVPVEYRLE